MKYQRQVLNVNIHKILEKLGIFSPHFIADLLLSVPVIPV